jgi:hypothetical protein
MVDLRGLRCELHAESGGAEKGQGYNPVRGQKVIDYARGVLDQAAALATGSHRDATGYLVEPGANHAVEGGRLVAQNRRQFVEQFLACRAVACGCDGGVELVLDVLTRVANLDGELPLGVVSLCDGYRRIPV